jgi:hypothetical protein
MKAAETVSTLLIVIFVVIALLVAWFFANISYVKGMEMPSVGTEAQQIMGEQAEVTYMAQTIPSEESETADHIYSLLNPDDPFRPSEIACYIANAIFDDYIYFGDSGDRNSQTSSFSDIDCEPSSAYTALSPNSLYHYCLIDSRKFELQQGGSDELGTTWINDLAAVGCKLCEQGGVVVPELDEVCINYNLDRTTPDGGYEFCKGAFDPEVGGLTAFSNCDCGNVHEAQAAEHGNDGVSGWGDNCDGWYCLWPNPTCFWSGSRWIDCPDDEVDDFCDNERPSGYDYAHNMIVWNAEKVGSDLDQYFVSDYEVEEWRDEGEEYNFNSLNKTPHEYIYGILWIPELKRYNLYFERVPASKEETNFDFLMDEFLYFDAVRGDTFKRRMNPLGYTKPEARRIMDRVVTPQTDISVVDIMIDLRDKLNELNIKVTATGVWNVEGLPESECEREGGGTQGKINVNCIYLDSSCNDIDCINNNIERVSGMWHERVTTVYEKYTDFATIHYKFTDYNIKFNIDSSIEDGILLAGQKYRIVLNNWAHLVKWINAGSGITYPWNAIMIDRSVGIYPIVEEEEEEIPPTPPPTGDDCTSCSSWVSGECYELGSCSSGYIRQTRTCTPAGCTPTDGEGLSRCQLDSSCCGYTSGERCYSTSALCTSHQGTVTGKEGCSSGVCCGCSSALYCCRQFFGRPIYAICSSGACSFSSTSLPGYTNCPDM